MATMNDRFPSKYLNSADIKGTEPTMIISHINEEMIKGEFGEEQKSVLYFQNEDKGMVLNKTNWQSIAELHGSDDDDWAGHEITLFVTKVQGPKGLTDGLRVKPAAPKKLPPKRPPPKQQMKVEQRDGYQVATGGPPAGHPADDDIPF